MSNLSFSDKELMEMEATRPATCREPYHLTYAKAFQGNEILNPHLPGNRQMAAGQESQEGGSNDERNP